MPFAVSTLYSNQRHKTATLIDLEIHTVFSLDLCTENECHEVATRFWTSRLFLSLTLNGSALTLARPYRGSTLLFLYSTTAYNQC